ncbi:MAG: VanZ family protein [Rhizobiaceae bacterium]|nr:VanZ family protein [Rhizobiaceae bacterium]
MNFVRFVAACCGWALLAYIGYVTLSPIEQRPHVGAVLFERFMAFSLLGFFLGTAYSKYGVRLFWFVIAIAAGLEIGQLLAPGRHGEFSDALEKAAGGAFGVAIALALTRLLQARLR